LASFRTAQGKLLNLAAERTTSVRHILGNDIVLPHPSVSKTHAVIKVEGRHFFVRDLDIANGTWFGKRRVKEIQLEDGDRVRFGEVELTFAGTAGASGAKQALARKSHRLIKAAATLVALCSLSFAATRLGLRHYLESSKSTPVNAISGIYKATATGVDFTLPLGGNSSGTGAVRFAPRRVTA
jgi:FHA domain